MMEQLLQGMKGVACFLDDIIITGKDKQEHIERLKAVLERFRKSGLKLKRNKCEFFKKEVKYLGFVVNKGGVSKDIEGVVDIRQATSPTSVTEVRSFLGMVTYYGRFLPELSTLLRPLYDLLKEGITFKWSEECEAAFITVKKYISSDLVLAHFDPELPLRLTCDASGVGLGAVLAHVDSKGVHRPIAYAARTLNKSELNYSVVEKEALAIVFAVKRFHQYLYGKEFELATDHKPLVAIFGEHKGVPQMIAGRLQRWAIFLSGYRYRILHIQGKNNLTADFLSRSSPGFSDEVGVNDCDGYLHFIETQQELPVDSNKIRKETRRDIVLSRVRDYIEKGWPSIVEEEFKPFFNRKDELSVEQECVLWGYRVVVPLSLRPRLLEELHASHTGIVKMKTLARSYIWWPGVDKEIEGVAKSCDPCLFNRPEPNKAVLIPWHRPVSVWSRVHIDYLGPVKGKMYLIIIDATSKWPEVLEVAQANAACTVETLRETFARFGLPVTVVSDNGTTFTAEIFRSFLRKNGIKHVCISPGHPATNGQAENGVKSFKAGLLKAMMDHKNEKVPIKVLVSRYLLNYRNAVHVTTQSTPAKLMFGRSLRIRLDLLKPDIEKTVLEKQQMQKDHFSGKRNVEFYEGDQVMVRDYSMVNKKHWLTAIIEERQGLRNYLCLLDDGRRVRRHTDQIVLKKRRTQDDEIPTIVQGLDDWGESEKRVEAGENSSVEGKQLESLVIRRSGRATKGKPPNRLDL